MSYSRRQLYAMGEPFGESATRHKLGGRIYGGGGSAPSTTTQISELPEWARGYAKESLGKAAALTDTSQNPYQAYNAPRIAGFSPMQEQAQKQAAGMTAAPQMAAATGLTAEAGLRGLEARYDPTQFASGQFGQGEAEQYMSPYMQSVVDIQKREAQRASDIGATQRGAQATAAGAFGGSRQAIVEAEAQRNLAQQKGDIQAQGSQAAFQQAQAQFNADQARRMQAQQLAEQSKQYGAGYGMQGLGIGLQGAGQLGQLGVQQFTQGMDINKLQSAYGGQQQALQQQGLTQGYQDFQNQQNYPYKQLGFMSDLIRGLPLGQQSTAQVYEAPGSIAGQIGGIGMGMMGLSKFMADGGSVDEYADGGVTSEENVDNILSKLTDQQLQQAKQSAQGRGDVDRLDAIDAEIAQRASMRFGLGSIPIDHEAMMPDESVGMANGGIVAFGAGGDVPRYDGEFGSLVTDPQFGASPGEVSEAPQRKRTPEEVRSIVEALRANNQTIGLPQLLDIQEGKISAPPVVAKQVAKPAEKRAEPQVEEKAVKRVVKEATSPAAINKAITAISEETGAPKKTLIEQYKELQKELSSNNKATTDILTKAEEALAGRAGQIKEEGLARALMDFGFKWAASASKPRAKFIGSAAEAAPAISQSLADTKKLQMAAEDNMAKMQIDRAKYEQAMDKSDTASAIALLGQIRQGEQQAAELAERIKQNAATNALTERQIGVSAKSGTPAIMKIADDLQASNPSLKREDALTQAARIQNVGSLERTDVAANAAYGKDLAELQKAYEKSKIMVAPNTPESRAFDAKFAADVAALKSRYRMGDGQAAAPVSTAGFKVLGVE